MSIESIQDFIPNQIYIFSMIQIHPIKVYATSF